MGKNIFALKIFLPTKLKVDLQERADKAQASLGKFARAMICAHLFGRDVGPKYLMAANQAA
jgi:CBS-domain-containing membrane protein